MLSFNDFKEKHSDLIINDSLSIKGGACTDSSVYTYSSSSWDAVVEADGGDCPPKIK